MPGSPYFTPAPRHAFANLTRLLSQSRCSISASSGSIELDQRLVIRKADKMAGLVFGLAHSALNKQPVAKLLDIPNTSSW